MSGHLSLWRQTADMPARRALPGDIRADAAVIGAGMAGALTAYLLQKRGLQTVVLEAQRTASGQTGNTTAKITSQHGMVYDALIKRLGAERAGQYARANERAIRAYADIAREVGADCDFETLPAYLYALRDAPPLEREAEAARALGIKASFTRDAGLPFPTAGAVRFDGQAQFHPLKFLHALCENLTIYEHTPALKVEKDTIFTPGGTVTAPHIVFATHYPFVNVPGWYFLRMHQERSYVLALKSSYLPHGLYYGTDADGLSLRAYNDLLLAGGENHRTGENSAGGRYEALLARVRALLPGCEEVARWSAQDCVTLDGVPYIGRYARSALGWYVATGFGKWGMTGAMVSALLISGLIGGDAPEYAPAFAPSRFTLSASAKNMATEGVQAFKGLSREIMTLPEETLKHLPPGHGGVIEYEGRKAGVYREENGACHVIDTRCPHLGCQLEWNPDELSWDCPCHGSRFSFNGALIDNPAQEGLT